MTDQTELRRTSTTPFKNYEDWISDNYVVTFETIGHHLYNEWENQCVEHEGDTELVETESDHYTIEGDAERKVDQSKFSAEEIDGPGIYEDKQDGCYTIVLDRNFMTYELCQRWIGKLNQKFDLDLALKKPESEGDSGGD